jgi:type IV pilus assembly protein PilA
MPLTGSVDIQSQSSKYVSGVTYTNASSATSGVITAAAQGDTAISGSNITMTGTYASGQVTWVCGGSIAGKYRPSSCK